jgi:hypothetical protein
LPQGFGFQQLALDDIVHIDQFVLVSKVTFPMIFLSKALSLSCTLPPPALVPLLLNYAETSWELFSW